MILAFTITKKVNKQKVSFYYVSPVRYSDKDEWSKYYHEPSQHVAVVTPVPPDNGEMFTPSHAELHDTACKLAHFDMTRKLRSFSKVWMQKTLLFCGSKNWKLLNSMQLNLLPSFCHTTRNNVSLMCISVCTWGYAKQSFLASMLQAKYWLLAKCCWCQESSLLLDYSRLEQAEISSPKSICWAGKEIVLKLFWAFPNAGNELRCWANNNMEKLNSDATADYIWSHLLPKFYSQYVSEMEDGEMSMSQQDFMRSMNLSTLDTKTAYQCLKNLGFSFDMQKNILQWLAWESREYCCSKRI